MSRFVLDASIVLTWCFPDEESHKAHEVAERIAGGDRVIVPAFWRHEMLNALLVGEKRKRLTPELTQSFIDDLDRLPVDLDMPSSAVVFNTVQHYAANKVLRPTMPHIWKSPSARKMPWPQSIRI